MIYHSYTILCGRQTRVLPSKTNACSCVFQSQRFSSHQDTYNIHRVHQHHPLGTMSQVWQHRVLALTYIMRTQRCLSMRIPFMSHMLITIKQHGRSKLCSCQPPVLPCTMYVLTRLSSSALERNYRSVNISWSVHCVIRGD